MSVLLVERPAEGIALLRLNRPDALNALNLELRKAIAAALRDVRDDRSIKAVVVTGNEKAFAAGADLKELRELTGVGLMDLGIHRIWDEIAAFPKPLIAAVNGFALGGGCELAMHCDIIVAGEGARFGQPEVNVGILPGGSGTQRLTRAVGKYKAMYLTLTGEQITGRDAAAMGLASIAVPDAEVVDRAIAIARRIAKMPPISVQFVKEAVIRGEDASLEAGVSLERKMMWVLMNTEDKAEGMDAFINKRKPDFRGR